MTNKISHLFKKRFILDFYENPWEILYELNGIKISSYLNIEEYEFGKDIVDSADFSDGDEPDDMTGADDFNDFNEIDDSYDPEDFEDYVIEDKDVLEEDFDVEYLEILTNRYEYV